MKKPVLILVLLTVLVLFTSCESAAGTEDFADGDELQHETVRGDGTDKGKLPYIADYTESHVSYTVNISDGVREVILDVTREGRVTGAVVTSPEGLAGMAMIYDTAGLRLRPNYSECRELCVSEDAAAGLTAVFDVMMVPLGRECFVGGRAFSVDLHGYETEIRLSADGLPESASVGDGESSRNVTFSKVKLAKND